MGKPLISFLVAALLVCAIVMALHNPVVKGQEKQASVVATVPDAVPAHSSAMGDHMLMTTRRPEQAGDQGRAAAIEAAALTFATQYVDYRKAEADGFVLQYTEQKQTSYHFLRTGPKAPLRSHFDPANAPELVYEVEGVDKAGTPRNYKLVGVMYTAPFNATDAELESRVPLSTAQWHAHINLCIPPKDSRVDWIEGDAQFGEDGSIATEAACKAAGGKFVPHFGAWMLHVYPFHKDQADVWNPSMFDAHHGTAGAKHDAMGAMPGMKM